MPNQNLPLTYVIDGKNVANYTEACSLAWAGRHPDWEYFERLERQAQEAGR
jgi:hypothetical protein